MPVILATQEVEIKRTDVGSQPRQMVPKTLSQKNPTQKQEWQNGLISRVPAQQA
jgi:hypothetical protein